MPSPVWPAEGPPGSDPYFAHWVSVCSRHPPVRCGACMHTCVGHPALGDFRCNECDCQSFVSAVMPALD